MIKIIRQASLTTTKWSGGTTTQIFIFPESSDYKKMDFDFRISTATIDVETSTFTPLKGIKRTLMILEGTLELNHKDHHSTILEPLESDIFSGDWETSSGGKAVDFNLMIRNEKLEGYVKPLLLGKKKVISLEASNHALIYIYKGELTINDEDNLVKGDAIYFDSSDKISIFAKTNVTLIHVIIS